MKKLTTFFSLLLLPATLIAQQEHQAEELHATQSNLERYLLDYELINYTFVNGDSTILNDLNINGILHAREVNADVLITDLGHNVQILLYSETRMKIARGLTDPSYSSKTTEP